MIWPVIACVTFGLLDGLWPFAIVMIWVSGQTAEHKIGVGVGTAVAVAVGVGLGYTIDTVTESSPSKGQQIQSSPGYGG
jgi:hypothetical protein